MIAIPLLLLLILPLPGWGKDLSLFVIQRSKNRNEVQYHLRVDDRCQIAADNPIGAFWKLLEDSPEKTEPLSTFDRMAYGVERQTVEGNWVSFSLKALEHKRLKASAAPVAQTGTCAPVVQTEMNGHWAALERIYVHTEEGFLKPKVLYIDLFGKTLEATPRDVTERLMP
jgi:hypothetical protein